MTSHPSLVAVILLTLTGNLVSCAPAQNPSAPSAADSSSPDAASPDAAADGATPEEAAPPATDGSAEEHSDAQTSDSASKEPVTCTDPRKDMCTQDYRPVCATVDTGIRCIKAPCPSSEQKTFANGCSACADEKVLSYTPGACKPQ